MLLEKDYFFVCFGKRMAERKKKTILCVGRFLGQHIQILKFDSIFSVNFI